MSRDIMAMVRCARHLTRFFPTLKPVALAAGTVAEAVRMLDVLHPGIARYLVDERGRMRTHVNAVIGETLIRDREALSDTLTADDELYFLQALSGGAGRRDPGASRAMQPGYTR